MVTFDKKSVKMKTLFLLNSDFGVQNTIGARAYPIAKELNPSDLIIFCRDYDFKLKEKYDLRPVVPFKSFMMKALTAIPIYVCARFPSNNIKVFLFEKFLIAKLKKLDLSGVGVVHSWDNLPNVYSYLKNQNPEIKIFQDVPMAFPNVIKKLKNYQKIWNGVDLSLPKYIEDSIRFVDIWIAPSEFVKESLIEENISSKKIVVIPFGVDTSDFKPLKNPVSPFRVAFSGNVNMRKGITYLVEAWTQLKLKDAQLHIYGRVYPEVKHLFNDAKLNNIVLHGFSNTKLELPKNHLYVFPTLLEGSSKSVYEAMACELPVITTKNAGSVVRTGKEGFIIPMQNISAIKRKITYFYEDRDKLTKFKKAARERATNFTWKVYAKKIIKLYNL